MSAISILQGTPHWVWLLFVFLAFRGFKALKGGTAPLSKLANVPLIFAGMGIAHLVGSPLSGFGDVIAWTAGVLAGIAGGVYTASRSRFAIDPIERTVTLPGSIVPMLLILATFAAKFWIGVELATAVSMSFVAMYALIGAAISGIVVGMFAGRFFTYWKAMNGRRAMLALETTGTV